MAWQYNESTTIPITKNPAETTMDHPTEPLEQPSANPGGSSSGTTRRPPAGYFTDPAPADPKEAPDTMDSTAAAAAAPGTGAVRHPARVGTIVWGAVVLVAGILVILSSQLNLQLNAGLTTMWLLLGAGVAMAAGGAVKLLRGRRP